MDLVLGNHIIDNDAESILKALQKLNNNSYLKDIHRRGNNIAITCPHHKKGQENHPSCYVYADNKSDTVPFGYYRCFTCGEQGQLYDLVSICLGISTEDSKQWLIDNYSHTFSEQLLNIPEINIHNQTNKIETLDETILDKYAYFHPYMFARGLTEEVIRKFKIGYDFEFDSLTFPVWDEHNNLIGITRRSVTNKYFYIPENMGKPVYLLNYICYNNITDVVVCESQLDALKCWTWGIPAVALFGTGSKKQYQILNKSGIRFYHLAFDGDLAGQHGAKRFIENIKNDVFVDVIKLPDGKDVNDISREEFLSLPRVDKGDEL